MDDKPSQRYSVGYVGRRHRNTRTSLVGRVLSVVLLVVILCGGTLLFVQWQYPNLLATFNPFNREEPVRDRSVIELWDLVVYGSEPEGIAAAVTAARQGLSVLLVSPDPELGGLFTLGWLNSLDMSWDVSEGGRELLTRGFFEEWWGALFQQPLSFQVDSALLAFQYLTMAEPNLLVRLNQTLLGVECTPADPEVGRNESLLRAKFRSDSGLEYRSEAPFFIDASGDADLAALTSAPFNFGWEDVGRPGILMAPTLVFEVDNVNWVEVMRYARELEDPRYGANEDSAWAYWEIVADYQPTDLQTYLRGLNIGRQSLDWDDRERSNVLINALLIFDVDVLDPASKTLARQRGEAEARHIVDFLRREAPGFAAAEYVRAAPQLYIRESRHLVAMYTLTLGDVITEREFPDEIAVGAYPVDLQAVSPTERERTLYAPQRGYGVPLRSLIPLSGPANLLVVGRSAGFTSEAHGSARVVPLGMCQAEAAAYMVAYALAGEIADLRQLATSAVAVRAIQQAILDAGGYLRIGQ